MACEPDLALPVGEPSASLGANVAKVVALSACFAMAGGFAEDSSTVRDTQVVELAVTCVALAEACAVPAVACVASATACVVPAVARVVPAVACVVLGRSAMRKAYSSLSVR